MSVLRRVGKICPSSTVLFLCDIQVIRLTPPEVWAPLRQHVFHRITSATVVLLWLRIVVCRSASAA